MARSRGWSGEISRLSLRLNVPPDEVTPQGIHLLKAAAPASELEQLLRHGAKVELNGDQRNALPAKPGFPIRRTFTPARESRLQLAYGRKTAVLSGPLIFRVVLEEGPVLYEATLNNHDGPGWRDASIDLSDFGGRTIAVALEVESSTGGDSGFWAHPTITRARDRESQPNVVLISLDTLRADRLSLYGYERSTSPHLDAWARDHAVVFRSAVAQAPWTLPSHLSMFTGLNPSRFGSNMTNAARPGLTTMAEVLREEGYATLAVTGGAFLHPQYGLSQGFERYYYTQSSAQEDEAAREMELGVNKALDWLALYDDQPFFLFFHTYEIHDPYRPRQPYFAEFTDLPDVTVRVPPRTESLAGGHLVRREAAALADQPDLENLTPEQRLELLSAAYDSSIAFADQQLERLMRRLEEIGQHNRTIIVITSDHGELLGEHDSIGHLYLYEENILVPLIIATGDDLGAGQVVDRQVRSVDILPTLLELLELEPREPLDGRSLVPLIKQEDPPFPTEAFTYAARWNSGISLRLDNTLKYTYNDTTWSPLRGQTQLTRLVGEGEGTSVSASELDVAEADLEHKVRNGFFDQLPGLRIQFENRSAGAISGVLEGLANPYAVKSMDMDCDCLSLESPNVRFEIPEGHSFTTVLLLLKSQLDFGLVLETTGDRGRKSRFRGRIPAVATHSDESARIKALGSKDERHTIGLTDTGWRAEPTKQTADSETQFEAAISYWWEGADTLGEPPPVEVDPSLRDRLEALGYVEP